ncbi:MAG: hypothetical protein M3430_08615 [Acidobacteriota bacterium]|nr:hypothetical protein [Acidobacteriota bacterium]
MFALNLSAELLPVDARPPLIQSPVRVLVEMQLAVVRPSGGDLRVNVRVVGVPVNRGDNSRLRKVLP